MRGRWEERVAPIACAVSCLFDPRLFPQLNGPLILCHSRNLVAGGLFIWQHYKDEDMLLSEFRSLQNLFLFPADPS
jgi:hypothetical protein